MVALAADATLAATGAGLINQLWGEVSYQLDNNMLDDDMKVVVKSMLDRQPDSQEVKELAAWANRR